MSLFSSRAGKWLIAALALSLVINLLGTGYLLGREQRWRHGPPMASPHSQVGRFLQGLSDERRSELRPHARRYWRTSRESIRNLIEARHRVNQILGSEPLDEAALRDAMRAVDTALQNSSSRSQGALLEFIEVLSAQERIALSRSMQHPRGKSGGPHRHRQRPNDSAVP